MQLSDFASRSYKDLTEWEWQYLRLQGVCNGCGGGGNGIKNRIIRYILKWILRRLSAVFFEASCEIHDLTYWQGGGERRRRECDLGFFTAIIGDIHKVVEGGLLVLYYTLLALAFYYAVRISGKDYFHYH